MALTLTAVHEDFDRAVCQDAMFISVGGTDHVGLYLEIVGDRLRVVAYNGIHQEEHFVTAVLFDLTAKVEEALKFEASEENDGS